MCRRGVRPKSCSAPELVSHSGPPVFDEHIRFKASGSRLSSVVLGCGRVRRRIPHDCICMHNTGNNDAHQGVNDPLVQHHGVGRWTHRVMTDSGLKTISDAGEPRIARTTPRYSPQLDREKPDTTDASSDRSAPASQPSRWRRPLLIMGPVVLAVGALALYLMTGRYVSEEDAYVQAVSVSISPQVSGQVVSIAARSHMPVRKDDPLFNLDREPTPIAWGNAEPL